MDILTLNAVLAKLQGQADHCHYMLRWSLDQEDPDTREQGGQIWSSCLTQANEAVGMVQHMLEAELDSRDQEAA